MFIQDYLRLVGHRVTEGQKFWWDCYGKDSYSYSSDIHDSILSLSCVFDRMTGTVYEIEIFDIKSDKAYIWINDNYIDAFKQEALKRGVDASIAYDNVRFTSIGDVSEIYEIAETLLLGQKYDSTVELTVNIPESVLDTLYERAKENDQSVDEFIATLVGANNIKSTEEYVHAMFQIP
jgi:hypothetical protein